MARILPHRRRRVGWDLGQRVDPTVKNDSFELAGKEGEMKGREMKRILLALLIGAIVVLMAVPAGADKRDCSTYPDGHPQACQPDDPTPEPIGGGTVCDPSEYPEGITDIQYDDFTFTLSGNQANACIDVISKEGPWTVTITGSGARSLALIPRDSIAPGDSCGGYVMRRAANIYGTLILGYEDSIPAATINACGTDFGEWANIDLDGLDPAPVADGCDCAAIDEDRCLVTTQPDAEHPLVLQALLGGSRDGTTIIDVDLP